MSKVNAAASRRQLRSAKASPTGRLDVALAEERVESKTLIDKITSVSLEERHWAIGSLSRLITEDQATYELVSQNIGCLSALVKSMADPEEAVKIASAGLLRNLTNAADVTVCNSLIDKGCLTFCCVIIEKTTQNILADGNGTAITEEQLSDDIDLVINLFALLTNLCEISEYSMNRVASSGLLSNIFHWLKPQVGSCLSAIYAADLLNVLTEDFEPIKSQIKEGEVLLLKVTIANQKHPLRLRATVASILLNICPLQEIASLLNVILPTVYQCLDWNPAQLFLQIHAEPNTIVEGKDFSPEIEKEFHDWENSIKAQIMGLEVFSNILVDEEEGNEMSPFRIELVKVLLNSGLCNKVLPLCAFVDPKVPSLLNLLSEAPEESCIDTKTNKIAKIDAYLRLFTVLQGRALCCLSNIISTLPEQGLGNVNELWSFLFDLCMKAFTSSCDEPIQATVTSTMYAFLRKTVLQPTEPEVSAIFDLTRHPSENIRVDAIGMLGCIAKTPLGPKISNNLGSTISQALLDDSGWVIAEACDVIFSVFDDNFQDVASEYGLLAKLHDMRAFLISKLQGMDNTNPLFLKIEEIVENILPFLAYKKQQQNTK